MADNGRWFKLWTTSLEDPSLDNLSIADFGRWAKFGAYLKVHGNNGEIEISEPSRILCSLMQLSTFPEVIGVITSMPNCSVTLVTSATVTYRVKWANWLKYQGDYSGDRVAAFRAKKHLDVTAKKRREEKRIPPTPGTGFEVTEEFVSFYTAYPKHEDKQDALKAWHGLNGKRPPIETILAAIEKQKKGRKWIEGYIKAPASWLRKGCWEDEVDMNAPGGNFNAPCN